jgi:hypothetical protein
MPSEHAIAIQLSCLRVSNLPPPRTAPPRLGTGASQLRQMAGTFKKTFQRTLAPRQRPGPEKFSAQANTASASGRPTSKADKTNMLLTTRVETTHQAHQAWAAKVSSEVVE